MIDDDDYLVRLRETADRFRQAEDSIQNPKPKTVKRPYASPSGAQARSMNAGNAAKRVQRRRGGK